MSEQCFCHLNGYQVKDATARAAIATEQTTRETAIATEQAARATAISNEITARQNADYVLQSLINSNTSNISLIKNRRFIFVGDSYAGTSQWCNKLAADLNKNTVFSNTTSEGVTVNNDKSVYIAALGGRGFTDDSTVGAEHNGFLQLLTACYGVVENPETITDIVVLGGANDSFWDYDDSEVLDNMAAFSTYAKTNFVNAKGWLGFIGRIRGTNPSTIVIDKLLNAYYFYTNADTWYTYMKGMEYSCYLTDKSLDYPTAETSDCIHPGQLAGNIIAKNACNILNGGGASTVWLPTYEYAITPNESTFATPKKITRYTENEKIHVHMEALPFTYASTTRQITPEAFKIATQNALYANKKYLIQSMCTIFHDSKISVHPCAVEFNGYDINLLIMADNTSMTYPTYTNIINITIPELTFDIPTLYC